jgi:molybdopterin-guanine dinucleotide biosynthesis protein A
MVIAEPPLSASLLLLAGGLGRRIGGTKAALRVGETTLGGLVLDRLRPHFAEALISTRASASGLHLGGRQVPDRHPGGGPMAGIQAGLLAARYDVVFAVACDMPRITPALARLLVAAGDGYDAAVPLLPRGPEPVCASYSRTAIPAITQGLESGERKAADLLRRLHVRYLGEDELARHGIQPDLFWNINTPADYQAFLANRDNWEAHRA